jgi:hypothetical protein
VKVAICIPARETVCSGFAKDLAMLTANIYAGLPQGGTFNINILSGTLIADQRQNLVRKAFSDDFDYVLFLDADMRFPADTFWKLQRHGKDIVAANYATRRIPVKTVAFSDVASRECVYTDKDSQGLQEVEAVGMGCMLIKMDVFRKCPLPWFNLAWLPSGNVWVGEDVYFCKLAQAHGFKVYIDHDLSKQVRHIGTMEFTHDHAVECRTDDVTSAAREIEALEAEA